ncbi:cytochrome P450 [Amycolatopsis pithecellobii]|uniref:Cytochrome P450 n=1 Tax=Amycolatopsis pithecellobii TaxID=664692 RepID=A0A6N7Z1G0_9PSEU|nr:cytochrome P450 [Amycolatopsis pithecellobii]MTD53374.1 cytochrome P450 [Amycolatopsis pithecellobii]
MTKASFSDTARVAAQILTPTLAGGVIKRRPRAMAVAERLQLDRAGIRLLQRLRARYHGQPVRLRMPGRSVSVVLEHGDAGSLLARTPSPFSPATREKTAALSHFQPHGVLISGDGLRAARREFTEKVLEPGRALHELAAPWAERITRRASELPADGLDWDTFSARWWQLVREITLGGDTAEDQELTELLGKLRLAANWAYGRPKRHHLRDRFLHLVRRQVALDRPGSLAAALNATPAAPGTDPAGQVPHWLFAFDAAGIATFRALALLAAHPEAAARARAEATDLAGPRQLPFLRACVLESVRLWPTTPALLRESTTDTSRGRKGTTFLVFTPFFHRDGQQLPYADRFDPDIWLDGRAAAEPALVPFSAGPGACPGRDVVLYTTSMLLAGLVRREWSTDKNLPPGYLPATLDHFTLRFGPARPRR